MNAIRSISSDAELKQKLGSADKKDDVINGNLEEEKIKPKQENDKPKRNDDERINISISRKANLMIPFIRNPFFMNLYRRLLLLL